jgi:hypothetical protein
MDIDAIIRLNITSPYLHAIQSFKIQNQDRVFQVSTARGIPFHCNCGDLT